MNDTSSNSSNSGSCSSVNFGKIAAVSNEVVQEFQHFMADMEEFVKSTASLTGDELAAASAKLGERVTQLQSSLTDISGDLAQRARQGAAATNTYAHEQPWAIAACGVGLGLLLGCLLSRGK